MSNLKQNKAMNYDYLLRPPERRYEIIEEDEPELCELCELPATETVDIEPIRWPGQFMAKLCKKCAEFERKRIKTIKN